MHTDAKFWNGIAEKYARTPVRDEDAYRTTLQRTRNYLRPQDRVLELGCGTGSTALRLHGAVGSYLATDIAKNMLAIARRKAEADGPDNLRFQQAGTALDGIDGPFDAILAFNLLHLIADADAALRQIHDRLRPGGLFISKTPCPTDGGTPLHMRLMLTALPLLQWLGKAPQVHFQGIAALEDGIRRAGFEIIETGDFPARPANHFIVARKTG